jgi:recombination protein RecT
MSTNSLRDRAANAANQANAPAETKANTFPAMLEKHKGEIARALPKHIDPDRMARIALTAFRQTPLLAECEPRSVFAAVIQSSQLGLEVGLMGEAHLVPFGKSKKVGKEWVKSYECQLIPGYQGLVKLARNSGLVKDIYAHEVRVKDKFELTLGLDRDLLHEPLEENGFPASDEQRGDVTGFYAVAEYKDGSKTFIAMSVHEVNRIRNKSSGYVAACQAAEKYKKPNNSPWVTDYVAMGKKTAIRALCKLMPKSPELATALSLDEASERGRQGLDTKEVIEGTWAPIYEPEQPDGDGDEAEAATTDSQDQPKTDASAAAADQTAQQQGRTEPKGTSDDLNQFSAE